MKTVKTDLDYWTYIETNSNFTGIVIDRDGDKVCIRNGELHREDGPAIEWPKGYKAWYRNGKLHREEGPAIEYSDGDKEWYLHGEMMTEEEHKQRERSKKLEAFLSQEED